MRLICDVPIKFGNAPDDARPFKINDLSGSRCGSRLEVDLAVVEALARRPASGMDNGRTRRLLAQKLHHLRPFRRGLKWARP